MDPHTGVENVDAPADVQQELFYDLIFVAAIIKLGNLSAAGMKHPWQHLGIIFILFLTLWTTWFHNTMLWVGSAIMAHWLSYWANSS